MIPVLDDRNEEDILEQIKKLAPYYVPEWSFDRENPEPGTALSVIFSYMFKETLKRFNQVLDRNHMAFMNMLNAGILPAKPSEAFVTFLLTDGAREHVLIPGATKVMAESGGPEGPVVFETAYDMLASPALPVCAYKTGVDSGEEYINEVQSSVFQIQYAENRGFALFKGEESQNLQEHGVYFADEVLFNIKSAAAISLKFVNTKKQYRERENYTLFSDSEICKWEYCSRDIHGNEVWSGFERVMYAGESLVLFKQDNMLITKSSRSPEGNAIRCSLVNTRGKPDIHIEFDEVYASVQSMDYGIDGGIKPDRLFTNELELKTQDLFPFGEFYSPYDCFYICCNEVFSKKGSRIYINLLVDFELKSLGDIDDRREIEWKIIMKKKDLEVPSEPSKINIESVVWEYWNGKRWARLEINEDYEKVFSGTPGEANVAIDCPEDIEQALVNGAFDYCIRVRISKIWNAYKPDSLYVTPRIKKIGLKYGYSGKGLPLKRVYTLNNMEWMDFDLLNKKVIDPFEKIQCEFPALYIGFDRTPQRGPIHLYFSIEKSNEDTVDFQSLWEYYGQKGWNVLKVLDRTGSFANSGSIIFSGPSDFKQESFFRSRKYWLRVSNCSRGPQNSNIRINGIYINTVKVLQQESIYREMPKISTNDTEVELRLSRYPVISEEVFINEAEGISDTEQKELLLRKGCDIEFGKDEFGKMKYLWVRWKRVNDFVTSSAGDRHYMIDHSTGRIILNHGKYGKTFFANHEDRIMVNYKVGGGSEGNVPAHTINKLKNSIAFVDKVLNHKAAFGGCGIETQEQALLRETRKIKHRNRAVTEEDIEALVLADFRNIARVKCIPNLNSSLQKETGSIAVVVLPKGEMLRDDSFTEIKEEVKRMLLRKTSGVVAFADKITVLGPVAVEISVNVKVAVGGMEEILAVEKETAEHLRRFLNPQNGNFDKKGWDIGEHPHKSNFYTLIKDIKGVSYIEDLVIDIRKIMFGKKTQISLEKLDEMPYSIIKSGEHQVNVNVI
ncbi:MAG TPA: baseplate J/gp47 family protein [Ruminiclostridium sp.]|nr:baseplate J/gp47 family protein [Ruminiclostridium sp.]